MSIPSLSFSGFPTYLLVMGPFMSLFAIVQDAHGFVPPASISTQTWFLTAVGCAMGITKVALWLRNEGKQPNATQSDASNTKAIEQHTIAINRLIETDLRLTTNQEKLSDNQARALEFQGKILEAITTLKLVLDNHDDSTKAFSKQMATEVLGEIRARDGRN